MTAAAVGEAMRRSTSIVALGAAGLLAFLVVLGSAGSAAQAHMVRPGVGSVSGSSSVVSLRGAHTLPDIQPRPAPGPADPGNPAPAATDAGLPSVPASSGPIVSPEGTAGPGATVPAFAAPAVQANFDGINHTQTCAACQPPDPSAATSGTEIVQLVNTFIQVVDTSGKVQCGGGVTLNRLLRTTDDLTDPRIQYDNVNDRFSLTVTIKPASMSATPALWVAASDTLDACGTWRVYRLIASGGPFSAGTFLDFPMLGQDTDTLLMSTRNLPPSPPGGRPSFTVFGLPKSTIYAGGPVSVPGFDVPSLTAPVTNAGQPMISSRFGFFLAAVPGTGYKLFRLSNSGGPLVLQATINSPFSAPSRAAKQPGVTGTVDPSDGNILASPYFDGTSIWFAHDFDLSGFPAIRYGAINVSGSTVTTATARRSSTSDDFNPSLAVGISGSGPIVYLN